MKWGCKKKTVVFVTHDIEEAVFLGERVFELFDMKGEDSTEYYI